MLDLLTVVLADFIDLHDIRMSQPSNRIGFGQRNRARSTGPA